jgi:hypothetical protein
MGLDTKTYWLTDRQSQCDFDFDFEEAIRTTEKENENGACPSDLWSG